MGFNSAFKGLNYSVVLRYPSRSTPFCSPAGP